VHGAEYLKAISGQRFQIGNNRGGIQMDRGEWHPWKIKDIEVFRLQGSIGVIRVDGRHPCRRPVKRSPGGLHGSTKLVYLLHWVIFFALQTRSFHGPPKGAMPDAVKSTLQNQILQRG